MHRTESVDMDALMLGILLVIMGTIMLIGYF